MTRHLVHFFLEQPGPNLAHLLLGFPSRQLTREIARIDLQREPSRLSCLRTMYDFLFFSVLMLIPFLRLGSLSLVNMGMGRSNDAQLQVKNIFSQ